jgi:dTDP-4-dehydrorhamnose 3,5-epimerase
MALRAPNPAPLSIIGGTAVDGAMVVQTNAFRDARGQFGRLFDLQALSAIHGERTIHQINHSITHEVGAIRGLHFQVPPHGEAKWVRCIRGRVWDVAVDLRKGSPTFLKHAAVELSSDSMRAFFIPEGCAHGFQVLEPDSELLYLHTREYVPGADLGLRWDDPRLAISWPMAPTMISERDRNHPLMTSNFEGLEE